MKTLQSKLIEFHRTFGHPIRPSPTVEVPEKEVRLRPALIIEETLEVIEAMFDCESNVRVEDELEGPYFTSARLALEDARKNLKAVIALAAIKIDLPELADGLADLAYVVEGTNLSFGIDGEGVMAIVHRSNMAKAVKCPDCKGDGFALEQIDEKHGEQIPCTACNSTGRISIKDGNGKTVKPEGWKPPDIAEELKAQASPEFGLAGLLEKES